MKLNKKIKDGITSEVLSGKTYQMVCTHCGLMCDGVAMIHSLCTMFAENHRRAHMLDESAITFKLATK